MQNKSDIVVIAQMFPVGWSWRPWDAELVRDRDNSARERMRTGTHVRPGFCRASSLWRKELGDVGKHTGWFGGLCQADGASLTAILNHIFLSRGGSWLLLVGFGGLNLLDIYG